MTIKRMQKTGFLLVGLCALRVWMLGLGLFWSGFQRFKNLCNHLKSVLWHVWETAGTNNGVADWKCACLYGGLNWGTGRIQSRWNRFKWLAYSAESRRKLAEQNVLFQNFVIELLRLVQDCWGNCRTWKWDCTTKGLNGPYDIATSEHLENGRAYCPICNI